MDADGPWRTCYDCGRTHGPALSRVVAATYGADGTPPWQLLVQAKYETLAPEAVAARVTFIAAAIWETIETVASQFFEGGQNYTVAIPSEAKLLGRCANDASSRGWPALGFVAGLRAEDRPGQTGQAADARREAAQGKYIFDGDLSGANVLLLDDVYTSGYTMHDVARAVREAGATSVIGVVYARRVFSDAMALYREAQGV
jgi:phosphoribosylpyrophosphate synthetase